MAYSSFGKKVYASIKDLPQYTSIGNGDKIIIWNETRDGAAVVDFSDFKIDLAHTTFESTIGEVITLASDIQVFANTVNDEITAIQESVTTLENTINNELKSRIKSLEYIVAILLGSNSYWSSSTGLDILKNRFLIDGISPSDTADNLNDLEISSEENKNTLKWFNGFINTVTNYVAKMIPTVEPDNLLLQSKFKYLYTDTYSTTPSVTINDVLNEKETNIGSEVTTITSSEVDENGNTVTTSTTSTSTKVKYL